MKFSGILTLLKKEFARFFKDRRLVVALFLPGLLIYALYSLMGGIMTEAMGVDEQYTYQVACVNAPDFLDDGLAQLGRFDLTDVSTAEEGKAALEEGETDLVAVFPAGFDPVGGAATQTVELYFDTVSTESAAAYELVYALLSSWQYGEPSFLVAPIDLASEEDVTGMIFSMVAPMLVMMMLFTGCISVAPESIAGEKERGTFATMLVTPVKRSHIAIGKIVALSVISLLSGLCSFLGIMLSLPKLMGGELTGLGNVTYGALDYALILGVVLTSVLVMVSLTAVLSALAKSVKEASGMVAPLTAVVALLGLATSFMDGGTSLGLFFIPLLNSALSMNEIFSFAAVPLHALVTMGINLVCAAALSFLLTKMFDSEKIMFGK